MEATVGAVAVGLGLAAMVIVVRRGVPVIIAGAAPFADEALKLGGSAYDAIAGVLSATNEMFIGLVATVSGEPREEATEEVEHAEEFVEEIVKEVAVSEAATFVETVLIAAI